MADSDVDVCNDALARLGANRITALTEDTDQARVMNQLYAKRRDAALRGHTWNFAIRRVALPETTAEPVWGFDHQYQLPQDPFCLYVVETNLSDTEAWRIETFVSGSASYRVLLTDDCAVSIAYVARVTDVTLWDSLFADALSVDLAYHACYALTRNAQLKAVLAEEMKEAWRLAKSRDGQEGRKLERFLSTSLTKVR